MKIRLLSLLLISITLLSAKGGCSPDQDDQAVVGEWIWVKTFCCGRTSKWTSPELTKSTSSILINSDGTFKRFKNDTLETEGKYILRRGLNDFQKDQGDSALVIQLNDEYPAFVEFIGDTLLLARGYMDYDNVYYVRKTK